MKWFELTNLGKNMSSMSDDELYATLQQAGITTPGMAKKMLQGSDCFDRAVQIFEAKKKMKTKKFLQQAGILVPGTEFTLEEAVEWLDFCSQEYYNTGNSPVSDEEYDRVAKATKAVAPDHPFFVAKVRAPTTGTAKIVLQNPVYSLEKIEIVQNPTDGLFDLDATFERVSAWMAEMRKQGMMYCFVTPKFDGLTAILYYEGGRLKKAATGGDGREGKDVTAHVKNIASIPQVLKKAITCEVRGEVVMRNSRFEALRNDGGMEVSYANPRNLAAGTMGLKDTEKVAERGLDFCAWNLLMDGKEFSLDEREKFNKLEELGFDVDGLGLLGLCGASDLQRIKDYFTYLNSVRSAGVAEGRPLIEDVALDGIVCTVNEARSQSALGFGTNTPKFSIAVKFVSVVVETTVTGIDWQVSRNGRVVPTILLQPVSVEGSMISRATGDNYQQVIGRGISVGSTVLLSKAGLTIPKILAVTKRATLQNYQIPQGCPACGKPLSEMGVDLACRSEGCKGQVVGRLMHFFSVVAPGKVGISESFFQALYDAGLVKDISDMYVVSRGAMLATHGIGESRINAYLAAMEASKDMPLAVFLKALSISGLGDTWAAKIAEMLGDNGYKLLTPYAMTFDMVMDLLQGTGNKIPINVMTNFCTWFAVDSNIKMIQRLLQLGVKVLCSSPSSASADPNAVHFCVTGKTSLPRNDLVKLLEQHGFVFDSTVTKKTKILICNTTSASSKMRKAQANGTEIITEAEMLARIKGMTPAPAATIPSVANPKLAITMLDDTRPADSAGDRVLFRRGIQLALDAVPVQRSGEPNMEPPQSDVDDLDMFDS